MQVGKSNIEWSQADVQFVKNKLVILEENTVQNGEFTYAIRDAGVMVVFIMSISLGYLFAVTVIPSLRGITGGRTR